MVGDVEAFLARLYLRRMASVFGRSVDDKVADATRLNEVAARLDEVHRWQEDDLLPVRPDKIEVKDESGRPAGGRRDVPATEDDRFEQEGDLGIEAYATYLPIHFFPEGHWKEEGPGWGFMSRKPA